MTLVVGSHQSLSWFVWAACFATSCVVANSAAGHDGAHLFWSLVAAGFMVAIPPMRWLAGQRRPNSILTISHHHLQSADWECPFSDIQRVEVGQGVRDAAPTDGPLQSHQGLLHVFSGGGNVSLDISGLTQWEARKVVEYVEHQLAAARGEIPEELNELVRDVASAPRLLS
jgi:hypothetical protein